MKKSHSHRGERIGEEIRKIISDLIARELKDPAFESMISISYVKATDDASFATVYFTSLGSDDEEVIAGFENAKGFIRNEISRKLGIRRAPELKFKADEAERYGRRIDEVLEMLDLPEGKNPGREIAFDELPGIVNAYERYLVFTHMYMDGDTFGSAIAFADAMREVGKEAWVVNGEDPPRTLGIIDAPFAISAEEAEKVVEKWDSDETEELPYLAVLMDFADEGRLEGREALFSNAKETLCIDHHVTSSPTCDFSYIEPKAAATSEIVYRFLKAANLPLTEKAATALYVGVVTDTGRFQYASTTPETHMIAAGLLGAGADFVSAYKEIYQNIRAEKLFIQGAMLSTLEIFAAGKAAIAYVEGDVLSKFDAGEDEMDGLSEVLRGIIGVEVSVVLRELPDGGTKVSMRSKDWYNVAALATEFGGGGHVHAAGFSADGHMSEIRRVLIEKLTAGLAGAI